MLNNTKYFILKVEFFMRYRERNENTGIKILIFMILITVAGISSGFAMFARSGAWYMVCNLHEMTKGDKNEQELILKNFAKYKKQSGLVPASALSFEEFSSEKYIAMFIRFSSAEKDNSIDNSKENLFSFSEQNNKFFMSL